MAAAPDGGHHRRGHLGAGGPGRDPGVRHRRPRRRAPRASPSRLDESADLTVLSRTPVTVVSAGVKSILDIPATLERLETLGVAVVGYRTSRFPAFYLTDSGQDLDWRLDSPQQIAAVMAARDAARRHVRAAGRQPAAARASSSTRPCTTGCWRGAWPPPRRPASAARRSPRTCWRTCSGPPRARAWPSTWTWPAATSPWRPRSRPPGPPASGRSMTDTQPAGDAAGAGTRRADHRRHRLHRRGAGHPAGVTAVRPGLHPVVVATPPGHAPTRRPSGSPPAGTTWPCSTSRCSAGSAPSRCGSRSPSCGRTSSGAATRCGNSTTRTRPSRPGSASSATCPRRPRPRWPGRWARAGRLRRAVGDGRPPVRRPPRARSPGGARSPPAGGSRSGSSTRPQERLSAAEPAAAGRCASVEVSVLLEAAAWTEAEIELTYHVQARLLAPAVRPGARRRAAQGQLPGGDHPADRRGLAGGRTLVLSTTRQGLRQTLPELSPWYIGRPQPPAPDAPRGQGAVGRAAGRRAAATGARRSRRRRRRRGGAGPRRRY